MSVGHFHRTLLLLSGLFGYEIISSRAQYGTSSSSTVSGRYVILSLPSHSFDTSHVKHGRIRVTSLVLKESKEKKKISFRFFEKYVILRAYNVTQMSSEKHRTSHRKRARESCLKLITSYRARQREYYTIKIVVPVAYLETYSWAAPARGMITGRYPSPPTKVRKDAWLPYTGCPLGISSLKAGSITSMNLQLEGPPAVLRSTTGPRRVVNARPR